jgi:anion-transporting  ArsA/GET3 family ATPase
MNLDQIIAEKRLIVCVGAGGVGKTSMAAALGLQGAIFGRKVLVLTIDPAKRLANSLGLQQFGNKEERIDISTIGEIKGELWAMMLDGEKTFDDLIDKLAKEEKTREAILNNNIYKGITESIVGNQEYMATEKLYDVINSEKYDLIILDTPPVKNALDFLDAPGRMARFVDKKIMKWFLSPSKGKISLRRIFAGTSAALFRLLGYIFGHDFLEDITIFFQNFRDLYEGFQQRHLAVEKIFRADSTNFLIVAAPHEPAVEVAQFFLDELAKRKMVNPGIVVNQRHVASQDIPDVDGLIGEIARKKAEGLPKHTNLKLLARLNVAHRRLRSLCLHEQGLVQKLRDKMNPGQQIWSVPRLDGEVHDLQSLLLVGEIVLADRSI